MDVFKERVQLPVGRLVRTLKGAAPRFERGKKVAGAEKNFFSQSSFFNT
jgi:hypothetical protein